MVQSKQKGKRGDIVALKGKTTFELTDVNTGEVEVIEDTNMITNGLQDFLATYGYFGCDVLSNNKMGASSLWVNALGGLFLFDSRLDENVENTFMPAGVKMIGNGSKDMSNSGSVTELGSYNATESGLQSDGSVKFVYDFSTQQANGTIACVCLTSKLGGYIGMGSENGYYNASYNLKKYMSDNNHQLYSGIAGAENYLQHLMYPVYRENVIYLTNPYNISYKSDYADQHWSTTKKIQILKVRAGFSSVSIKNSNVLSNNNILATYDIDIPQDILDYVGTNKYGTIPFSDNEGNIFMVFGKTSIDASFYANYFSLNNNSYIWIMKIDRDMQVTAYEVTNNTGNTIYISRRTTVFDGGYIWTYTNNSPYTIYGIKYSDSTQIIETGISKDSKYNLFVLGRNLIGICNSHVSSDDYNPPDVYDAVNRTLKKTNGALHGNYEIFIPFVDRKGVYISVYHTGTNQRDFFTVLKDPRYLATINNLSEPVVKTASKTMKVTYTITEA